MNDEVTKECTSRRDFLRSTAAVAGAAVTGSVLPQALASAPQTKRPNLLFFYTEGQRADSLSLAGHPLLKTPNQDRIGREGVYFNNSFCTNALCAPARASALTGLYSHTSGALDNRTQSPLPSDIPIVTDLLHAAGYDVALIGKAHCPNGVRERYWDYYFGFNAAYTNYYAARVFEGRDGKMGEEKTFENVYADDLFTDRALAWLKQERERPFCLLLWLQTPHAPFYRPRRYLDLYNGIPIPKPATFDDDLRGYPGKPSFFMRSKNKIGTVENENGVRSLEELAKDYYAGLAAVDDNLGRVLQLLESNGQLDDTAIVHSSDHGFFLGEWRFYDKRLMHEPSIRTPTMVRYPRLFKPGTKVDEMVLTVDLAPTLLELAGVPVPEAMQGKSFVRLAQGKETQWRDDWMYEYFAYRNADDIPPSRGVRTKRYKYIHYYLEPQQHEMYDLENDPAEVHNLYGDPEYAGVQQKLVARLAALRRETRDTTTDVLQ